MPYRVVLVNWTNGEPGIQCHLSVNTANNGDRHNAFVVNTDGVLIPLHGVQESGRRKV